MNTPHTTDWKLGYAEAALKEIALITAGKCSDGCTGTPQNKCMYAVNRESSVNHLATEALEKIK